MRYINELHGFTENEVERAERLFERLIGYRMTVETYEDNIRYGQHTGGLLEHLPVVQLVRVMGRTSDYGHHDLERFFGMSAWTNIDLSHVTLLQRKGQAIVALPPTLFGGSYEEVQVTYEAGLTDIPQEVQEAILEIAKLLKNGKIDEWNCFLPDSLVDIIQKHKRRDF